MAATAAASVASAGGPDQQKRAGVIQISAQDLGCGGVKRLQLIDSAVVEGSRPMGTAAGMLAPLVQERVWFVVDATAVGLRPAAQV